MSDEENFLSRWSRRKQDAADASAKAQPAERGAPQPAPAPEAPQEGKQGESEPFDLTKLPSIDSISAESDIQVFLQPGVPAELRHAALRRAWVTDPAIRDFVGLQENDWDFNKPSAIAGFGPIGPEHNVADMVARLFGEMPAPKTVDEASQTLEPVRETKSAEGEEAPPETKIETATANGPAEPSDAAPQTDEPVIAHRHGSALPHPKT